MWMKIPPEVKAKGLTSLFFSTFVHSVLQMTSVEVKERERDSRILFLSVSRSSVLPSPKIHWGCSQNSPICLS